MPSPFPGMDPYLEAQELWPDVHHALIAEMQAALNERIRPAYVARVEMRVYVLNDDDQARQIIPDTRIETTKDTTRKPARGAPNGAALAIAEPTIVPIILDEEVEEARLEIAHRKTGKLVTVIEVLGPANKIRGSEGRRSFLRKRQETLASQAHWVEIDLLRAGVLSQSMGQDSDYRVLVSKAEEHRRGQLWAINLRQPLPVIGVPLRAPDADVPLDLGAVLNAAYDRAAYDLSVDYTASPEPRLEKSDAKWADKLLRAKGLR